MNVTHIIPAISNEASGPSYSVVRLCESLIDAGESVTLAALDWEPIDSPPACLRTFPLGLGPRRLGRSPAMSRWLDAEAYAGRVGVLHNHGMWQMNAVYPGRVAAKYNTPFVLSPRGTWSEWAMANGSIAKKPFWSLIQRPAVESVTCFHATAENEHEDIRRLGFRQPVAVIPNGVDIPTSLMMKAGNRRTLLGNRRTLLFLSRIDPKKGLDMLLPAWKAVQARFKDWQLKVVGNDEGYYSASGYLAEMRELSVQLGLQRIEFVGDLHGIAKWQAYADADLFVLPTYSENFGMCVAEALAAGTPAIVTKGAPWEGLDERDAGRWIETERDALIATCENLMQHTPEQLQTMGQRGREWMSNDYSWYKIGLQMSEVYRWLAGESTVAPVCVQYV